MTQNLKIRLQNFIQVSIGNMDDLVHLAFKILEDFGNPTLLGKLNQRPMTSIRMLNHLNAMLHQANLEPLHYS